jgi:hypothetical protein
VLFGGYNTVLLQLMWTLPGAGLLAVQQVDWPFHASKCCLLPAALSQYDFVLRAL